MGATDAVFDHWLADLERRHFQDLTFPEVSRALRALSSTYVERRAKLGQGAALTGAGKRAAFALFYGPLHFLLIRSIARSLTSAAAIRGPIVDLGCGTGAAGSAWASVCGQPPEVVGVDRHPWAVDEARRTYQAFGLRSRVRVADLARLPLPARSAVLLAFAVNELDDSSRAGLRERLLEHAAHGGQLLIVEPLAGFVAPWWADWRKAIEAAGGRGDEWRFRLELPPLVEKLDRAAGLNHRELTGRSLWI